MASLEDLRITNEDRRSFGWWDLAKAYWFLLGEQRMKWLALTFLLLLIHVYALVPPFLMGKIVDFFSAYKNGDPLGAFYTFIVILGGSFVFISFARLSIKRVVGNIRSETEYQIKVKGFEKLIDFSLKWHLEEGAGTKSERVQNGVEAFSTLNRCFTNTIPRSMIAVVGGALVFAFLRPRYVIFFVAYALIFWCILRFFYQRINRENEDFFASKEKAGGSYIEGLSNILTIKTLGAGLSFKKHVASKEHLTKTHDLMLNKLYTNFWKTFQGFNGICYGVFLYFIGQDVITHQISPGSLIVFYGYLQELVGNAGDVMDVYADILKVKAAIGRMMSIFEDKTTVTSGTKKLPQAWDAIVFDHAEFAYKQAEGSSRGTIKDLTLSIKRGTKIGVVGKTGSGKSTLAKLLVGLYPLSSGAYTIGGRSFYELTHEEQTKHVTLVLQETEVFHLSLRDNVTLMRSVPARVLERALRVAQLEELVAKMPEGLETLVGEKGYHLSGGERQRVGIARAICKGSSILILDEATSSLDSKTELLIQQALEEELKDETVISIAHRVSTLQKTDVIYVFDEGKIVETGTFRELAADPASKFYQLSRAQQTGA